MKFCENLWDISVFNRQNLHLHSDLSPALPMHTGVDSAELPRTQRLLAQDLINLRELEGRLRIGWIIADGRRLKGLDEDLKAS